MIIARPKHYQWTRGAGWALEARSRQYVTSERVCGIWWTDEESPDFKYLTVSHIRGDGRTVNFEKFSETTAGPFETIEEAQQYVNDFARKHFV